MTKPSFQLFLKGMAMGAADVVPGVSGGTIAFITGIYKKLIDSISQLKPSLLLVLKNEGFASFWKKSNATFLINLFAGVFVSIFSLMKVANYLLDTYPILVWSFFFGLVLASVVYLLKQVEKWNIAMIILLALSCVLAVFVSFVNPSSGSDSYLYLFISGAIASCAMILPGLSGAFILVLLGSYKNVTDAVSNFDIVKIVMVALGAVVGLLSFARLLKFLFEKYNNLMMVVLTGFVAGSLTKIWPWKITTKTETINNKEIILEQDWVSPFNFPMENYFWESLLTFGLGLLVVFGLEALAKKKNR